MAKSKNKKSHGLADKFHAKKTQNNKFKRKLNPFEVHINKEKIKVLGKRSKNDRGLPGVSRAKAIQKRKNTLGYELKLMNKSNTFLDRRIGEKNAALSEEDKMMARFAAERIQQHKAKTVKQSIYNLADDEVLTHKGQTLEEIEKFDDPRSDDDDDDPLTNKDGNLRGDFVTNANFGGGVLSRTENVDGAKSRKDFIEQLIIESKKRKLEKQKLKEETLDLTEKLDTEWKDLHPMVSKTYNKENDKKEEAPSLIDKLLSAHEKKNEDYDKTMRQLKFEPRGTPSDRLKSEDEIAKIEKDKLEKLEQDRIARMHGMNDVISSTKPTHRSADDLDDDGYEVDSDPEIEIAYDSEGKLLVPIEDQIKKRDLKTKENHNEEDENNIDDQSNSEDGSDNESEDSLNDLRDIENSSSDDENENVHTEENIKNEIQDHHDKADHPEIMKTKKKHVSFSFNEEPNNKSTSGEMKSILVSRKRKLEDEQENEAESETKVDETKNPDKIKEDLIVRKEMMEKAAQELPYTYDMPKDYEEFIELLENRSPEHQHVIVERIIKCSHPSLGENNIKKLRTLFAFLLQYLNDLFSEENLKNETDIKNAFKTLDNLICHYYRLSQMDPQNANDCILEVLKEKYEEYKLKSKKIPSLDTLIFFKIVSMLFSTSDLKHPVATPCFHFMSQILTFGKIKSSVDISRALFIIIIITEFTSLSKRFLPSTINFLKKLLFLYLPENCKEKIKISPLPKVEKINLQAANCNMHMNKEVNEIITEKMLPQYLICEIDNNEFKIKTLITALKLLNSICKQSDNLHCQVPLFQTHLNIISVLPKSLYPTNVVSIIDQTKSEIDEILNKSVLKPLIEENKKPKSIRLYEPSFETTFDGKKKKAMSKERNEHQKLLYKHRKEMKGALREIRRDKAFISSVKIKEKIRSDNIRKQKVRQIFSEASLQQGELNALQRSKKRKK